MLCGHPEARQTPPPTIDALTRDVTTFPMRGPVGDVATEADPAAVWVLLARAK
jgi:hypothetical protein